MSCSPLFMGWSGSSSSASMYRPALAEGRDVVLKRSVKTPCGALAFDVVFHRHVQRAQITVHAAVGELAARIKTPTALPRHPEARMQHKNHQSPALFQRPARRAHHCVQRVHILDAEEKHNSVETLFFEGWKTLQLPHVGADEFPRLAVVLFGRAHE